MNKIGITSRANDLLPFINKERTTTAGSQGAKIRSKTVHHLCCINIDRTTRRHNSYFLRPTRVAKKKSKIKVFSPQHNYHHHHHQSLNREGRWGTKDDFATCSLYFSLFFTALWDLPNSRTVHSLMLSSHPSITDTYFSMFCHYIKTV